MSHFWTDVKSQVTQLGRQQSKSKPAFLKCSKLSKHLDPLPLPPCTVPEMWKIDLFSKMLYNYSRFSSALSAKMLFRGLRVPTMKTYKSSPFSSVSQISHIQKWILDYQCSSLQCVLIFLNCFLPLPQQFRMQQFPILTCFMKSRTPPLQSNE